MNAPHPLARDWRVHAALALLVPLFVGVVALGALGRVQAANASGAYDAARHAIEAEGLRHLLERRVAAARLYLITGDPAIPRAITRDATTFTTRLESLRLAADDDRERTLLAQVAREAAVLRAENANTLLPGVAPIDFTGLERARARTDRALDDYVADQRRQMEGDSAHLRNWIGRARRAVGVATLLALTLGMLSLLALRRALERWTRRREEAVRARNEFLHVATQELGRPVLALRHDLEATRATDPAARDATRQVARLDGYVHALADAAAIQAGHLRILRTETELSGLVRDVARRLDARRERAGCPLDLRLDRDVRGLWDRERLEQVVEQLLTNAYADGSGRTVRVTLTQEGEVARLVVRDHGVGMDASELERVFEPFEGATLHRGRGGLGLGLFLVRGIAEAHGGVVEAESSPGEGTRIVVSLPRVPAVRAPPASVQPGSASQRLH